MAGRKKTILMKGENLLSPLSIRERVKDAVVFLLSAALLLIFTLSAYAAPKIAIIPEEYRFDEITEGETVTHKFTIENRGDSELIINELRPG